jgi:hypothetical protein
MATTTTTFADKGTKPRHVSLHAHFFPSTRSYAHSDARYREIVNPAGTPTGNVENIVVIVPQRGAFSVTITPCTLFLTLLDGGFVQGILPCVTVTDTRNYDPGWSVSGQESGFTGSSRGFGTYVLTAPMYLAIPPTAAGGPYNGALTITFVEANA